MKRYVQCPNGGRCGHKQHQVGSAQLFRCGRAGKKNADGAAQGAIMTPASIGSPIKDAYIASGVHVDMQVEGNAFLSGSDTYISDLHAKRNITAYRVVAHRISSDEYIMVSEHQGGDILIEEPGQILLIESRTRGQVRMPLSLRYPADTTHVYRTHPLDPSTEAAKEAAEWATRRRDWARFSALPKDDPLWVDARNESLVEWVEAAGGVDPETGDVDRNILAAGLTMFHNP